MDVSISEAHEGRWNRANKMLSFAPAIGYTFGFTLKVYETDDWASLGKRMEAVGRRMQEIDGGYECHSPRPNSHTATG